MKEDLWKVKKSTQTFETAFENMSFDETKLNILEENIRFERYYIWKNPGITYSFKQECPENMKSLDHSIRLTGGGIVFHSPGDLVFSIASSNNDPHYPKKSKDKLTAISSRLLQAFKHVGIELDKDQYLGKLDYTYCQSYPTPFEISLNKKKICGLTIRQFKSKWLIQGSIHTKETHPEFFPFLDKSERIKSNLDTVSLLEYLI